MADASGKGRWAMGGGAGPWIRKGERLMMAETKSLLEVSMVEPLLEEACELAAMCRPFLFWSPTTAMAERLAAGEAFARRIIDRSNLVIYVTSSEKRADFRVHEEVRRWAARKR